jgi:hypothetical protein
MNKTPPHFLGRTLELRAELRSERLVRLEHKRRTVQPRDMFAIVNVFPNRNAQKRLIIEALFDSLNQFFNRSGLVAVGA